MKKGDMVLFLCMGVIIAVCILGIGSGNLVMAVTGAAFLDGMLLFSLLAAKKEKNIMEEEFQNKMEYIKEAKNQDADWLKRVLAHNIRMPLSIMTGYLDLITRSDIKREKQQEYLDKIHANASYLNHMVHMTLEQEEGNFARQNLTACVEEIAGYMKHKLDKAGISIHICAPVEIMLDLDNLQIMRLFYNLFENSIKYMGGPGQIQITMKELEHEVYVIYRDDGKGIERESAGYLFLKGYRGSQEGMGNGLGLYFVKEAVELHGGTVSAVSDVGKGLGIYMKFPKRVIGGRKSEVMSNL